MPPQMLKAGIDYPRNEENLLYMLESALTPPPPVSLPVDECLERASRAYIAMLRKWPQEFSCPLCHKPFPANPRSRDRIVCSNRQCVGHEETLTSRTLLHATKTKLFKWILAVWFVSQKGMPEDKNSLADRVGISVKAATQILRSLRQAMGRANGRFEERDPITVSARVAVAEGDISVEFSLCMALTEAEAPASKFSDSPEKPVTRWIVASFKDAGSSQARMPVATLRAPVNLLKRWDVRLRRPDSPTSREDLQWFLEEFVFLENHRAVRNRGLVFYELMQELLAVK